VSSGDVACGPLDRLNHRLPLLLLLLLLQMMMVVVFGAAADAAEITAVSCRNSIIISLNRRPSNFYALSA
jgi:hypothetical protein